MRFVFAAALLLAVSPALANPPASDLWIDWHLAVYRECLRGSVPFHPNCDWEFAKAMRHIVAAVRK